MTELRGPDGALELVLGKLEGVRRQGGYWMARCPAHDDRAASLSVARGTEQPVVLKCHAGCETASVLDAIGLTTADISAPQDDQQSAGEWTPSGPAVAIYNYTDERGELLFQVLRAAGKRFLQRRPDRSASSGWAWKLDTVRRVPYHLPQLIDAVRDGKPVYVVEGEKDVHAIEAAGGVATCNPGGAGKWRREYDEFFPGADVVIVADRDKPDKRGRIPGAEHAEDVAAHLRPIAKNVLIVEAAAGKDAADHLAAGHSLSEFRPAVQAPAQHDSDPEPWEEPVPLGSRRVVPPFPVETLPGWLSEMVQATATETQTPADIAGTLALAALSTAAGGKVVVHVRNGWSEPVNLYVAAIAEPGTRKSAVYQALTAPLSAAETALEQAMAQKRYEAQVDRERLEARAKDAQQAAIKAKGHDIPNAIEEAAKAARDLEEAPVIAPVQLITGDISPEECTTVMAAQGGRLAIMSAEGRIFDIITGRYNRGDPCLSPFLEGHAGDPLRVNRRERHEVVERPALTIGVCIQPAVLTEVMTRPRLRGQGMLARILYALPPDHVGYRLSEPMAAPAEVRDRYAADLQAMVLSLADHGEPLSLALEETALKVIVGYMDEIEPRLRPDGDLYVIRDWAAKLAGHAVRIAGLLHVAEHLRTGYAKPVTEITMGRAILLASYYAEHALAAFGVMSAHPSNRLARAILDWACSLDASFTRRQAHKKLENRVRDVEEIAAALRLLEDHGYIRQLPPPKTSPRGGRPSSPSYVVIPTEGRQNIQNPRNGG